VCCRHVYRDAPGATKDLAFFRDAKGLEDIGHGAEFGEAVLKKVETDKGSEKEPVRAVKDGAYRDPKEKA